MAIVGVSAPCEANVVVELPSTRKLSALLAPPPSRPEPRNAQLVPVQWRTKICWVPMSRPVAVVVKSVRASVVVWYAT